MSIMHFDTTNTDVPVFVTLNNVTAAATTVTPTHASSGIYARNTGNIRRSVNGAWSTMYEWISPINFAPGQYEISRGISSPYDLDDQADPGSDVFGEYFGPLSGVWTQISTNGVFWSWMTTGVSSYTATFPVYIRENTGTPGPVLDSATWSIQITENASGGGGGGGGCFTGNMRVLMADGSEKRISDVLVGEAVMSLNTQTGDLVASRVNELMVPRLCDVYELHLSNGKVIETTSEHPFRTVSGKWAAIDPTAMVVFRSGNARRTPAEMHIKEGLLLHGAEEHAKVTKIVDTGRKETVYHLAHVGMRNFFVEGFCVHNIEFVDIK